MVALREVSPLQLDHLVRRLKKIWKHCYKLQLLRRSPMCQVQKNVTVAGDETLSCAHRIVQQIEGHDVLMNALDHGRDTSCRLFLFLLSNAGIVPSTRPRPPPAAASRADHK